MYRDREINIEVNNEIYNYTEKKTHLLITDK